MHFCSVQPPLLSCAAPLTSALSAAHSLRLLFLLPWFGSYFPVLWFGKPQAGGQSKCGFHFCFSSLKVPIPAPCVGQSLKTGVPYILSSFIVVYGRRVSLISFTSVMAMPQLLCSWKDIIALLTVEGPQAQNPSTPCSRSRQNQLREGRRWEPRSSGSRAGLSRRFPFLLFHLVPLQTAYIAIPCLPSSLQFHRISSCLWNM